MTIKLGQRVAAQLQGYLGSVLGFSLRKPVKGERTATEALGRGRVYPHVGVPQTAQLAGRKGGFIGPGS